MHQASHRPSCRPTASPRLPSRAACRPWRECADLPDSSHRSFAGCRTHPACRMSVDLDLSTEYMKEPATAQPEPRTPTATPRPPSASVRVWSLLGILALVVVVWALSRS